MKNSLGLLIFVVEVLILCLSQHISVKKKHFNQELGDLGPLYFVSPTGNLGLSRAKAYKMEVLVSCSVGEKSSQ